MLGFPMSDSAFAQASLTPKLGGLGLRKTVDHANLAYHASWHESRKISRESWSPPPGMSAEYAPQKEASYKFDERSHKLLVSKGNPKIFSIASLIMESNFTACTCH